MVCHLDKAPGVGYYVSMMMNDAMREEYRDILTRLLEWLPRNAITGLSADELELLLQGLGELDPRTVLLPAFREAITQYRPIPVEEYRPRT